MNNGGGDAPAHRDNKMHCRAVPPRSEASRNPKKVGSDSEPL